MSDNFFDKKYNIGYNIDLNNIDLDDILDRNFDDIYHKFDIKYKGKNVILVQSEKPWYIDLDEICNNIEQDNICDNNNNDINKKLIENFNESILTNPLCWLIILILILIIIKYFS